MNKCMIYGCEQKHFARGFCRYHYNHYVRPKAIKRQKQKCYIDNCDRLANSKGLCNKHYVLYKAREIISVPQKCSIDGCGQNHYARGYCRKHYAKYVTNKNRKHLDFECMATDCHKKTSGMFCTQHLKSYLQSTTRKGEFNCNWKGGIAEYKNHSLMKRLRLIKLQSTNYTCEICGGKAKEVHHIDKNKSHHELGNFISVCHRCHIRNFHRMDVGRPRKIVNE